MSLFPTIEVENIVQAGDQTRLDASRSYVNNGDVINTIEIQPSPADPFIDVSIDRYLDWTYAHSGAPEDPEEIEVRVRINGGAPEYVDTIKVVTEETDRLFSDDARLRVHEPNIFKFIRSGRSTFKDIHRRARNLILAWMDAEGFMG